jgi:membrane protein
VATARARGLPRLNLRQLIGLFGPAYRSWREDNASRLGAALAYYTLFSIPPLLVLLIGIAGLVFGRAAVEGRIVHTIQGLVGAQGAAAIQEILRSAGTSHRGALATVIGAVTLVLGASGVFGQLKDALNTVWEVRVKPGRGPMAFLRGNTFSIVLVLGTGFLLLVSLAINAVLAALGDYLGGLLPGGAGTWQVVNNVASLAIVALMFGLMFKFVPDVRLAWRDVALGAVATAVLFTLGEAAIGFYLGRTNVGSAFGAAGSLVILLVWIYYSAQIFLFGAEYTKAYTHRRRSRVVPEAHAEPVSEAQRAQEGIPRTPPGSEPERRAG